VQSHVKNLYRKLEVSSKAEAVMVAVQQGLLVASH
jgi:DNA-binding CsgD family transcriptional regulator